MIIQSIELTNFRQFKNQKIEFSQDKDKNITVILGDNTYGKTTLIRAFLWGLYGDNKSFKDKVLLNKDVQDEMDVFSQRTVKVEIELEHHGKDYSICTEQTYSKTTDDRIVSDGKPVTHIVITDENGSKDINVNRANLEIGKILNPDLVDYFFFDGETNKIEEVAKTKNLKGAVSDLVGLKRLEELKDLFDSTKNSSVTSKFNRQIIIDSGSEFIDYQQDYDAALKEKEELENEKNDIAKVIEDLKNQMDEKSEIIKANEGTRDKQQQINDYRNDNKRILTETPNKFKNITKQLNDGNGLLNVLFAYNFINNGIDEVIDKTSFGTEDSISFIHADAIDQIIKRGYCLCGAKIENGNDAYSHLIDSKMHMEPHDFGKMASDFSNAEKSNIPMAVTVINNIHRAAEDLINDWTRLYENEDDIKRVSKLIEGHPDVGDVQKEVNDILKQIGAQENRMATIDEYNIPDIDDKIKKCADEIKKHEKENEENIKIKQYIDYCDYIYDSAEKELTNKGNEVLDRMRTVTQEIFVDMYHGNRKIDIDNNYNVTTTTNDDSKLEESQGLETVKNYSFVCALSKLVKEKIVDDMEESYPLVIDAPFSNTDPTHIANICNNLPKYCDQVIMFVMESHYDKAKSTIVDRVGKIYRLNKQTETFTTVEGDE